MRLLNNLSDRLLSRVVPRSSAAAADDPCVVTRFECRGAHGGAWCTVNQCTGEFLGCVDTGEDC
ncbi:hypothetical protein [Phytomonospora endophytica]|uniref:Uncharacterized protein n=1 Tax=Phytomonospora endophytica TaxID=714109 RepID=A0A841FSN0_9ACTN|nr:hypothetical protein [Phytomonospora endophytica]MBB6035529.1 hypothetical protein [Phytomonospora endophytica]GIG70108.1 hypothetical protein Pen01_64030 [Phytomonospora endophytica]